MRKSNLVLTNTGEKYRMVHEWDVAGDAEVEDIVGDIQDLIGIPHLMVEEVRFDNETPKGDKHQGLKIIPILGTACLKSRLLVLCLCETGTLGRSKQSPRHIGDCFGIPKDIGTMKNASQ